MLMLFCVNSLFTCSCPPCERLIVAAPWPPLVMLFVCRFDVCPVIFSVAVLPNCCAVCEIVLYGNEGIVIDIDCALACEAVV